MEWSGVVGFDTQGSPKRVNDLHRILGHSSIAITMRYAHLSPDHLSSALRLSPLQQSSYAIGL